MNTQELLSDCRNRVETILRRSQDEVVQWTAKEILKNIIYLEGELMSNRSFNSYKRLQNVKFDRNYLYRGLQSSILKESETVYFFCEVDEIEDEFDVKDVLDEFEYEPIKTPLEPEFESKLFTLISNVKFSGRVDYIYVAPTVNIMNRLLDGEDSNRCEQFTLGIGSTVDSGEEEPAGILVFIDHPVLRNYELLSDGDRLAQTLITILHENQHFVDPSKPESEVESDALKQAQKLWKTYKKELNLPDIHYMN